MAISWTALLPVLTAHRRPRSVTSLATYCDSSKGYSYASLGLGSGLAGIARLSGGPSERCGAIRHPFVAGTPTTHGAGEWHHAPADGTDHARLPAAGRGDAVPAS